MIPFDELFKDGELSDYLKEKSKDLWKGTYFENYSLVNNTCKGIFGEKMMSKFMPKLGCNICKRENKGHDLIIDGFKTEIKISLAQKLEKDQFALNHISFDKDWERLIFIGVNYDLTESRVVFFKKKEFLLYMKENPEQNIFKYQQGGKDIKNDDYLVMNNFDHFLNLPFIYNIYDWKSKEDPRGIEFWLR